MYTRSMSLPGILLMLCCWLTSEVSFAQTDKILKVLNRELNVALTDVPTAAGKGAILPQYGFRMKDSAGIQLLVLYIRQPGSESNPAYWQQQEVDLRKIQRVVKDINVIFETLPDAVVTTTTDHNGSVRTGTGDMFFLHLSYREHNEDVAKELIKTFKKAGITIEKGYWHD